MTSYPSYLTRMATKPPPIIKNPNTGPKTPRVGPEKRRKKPKTMIIDIGLSAIILNIVVAMNTDQI